MTKETSNVVIDACCLINLCAVGDLHGILCSMRRQWHLADAAARESNYLRMLDADGNETRQAIDLRPVIESGALRVCSCEGEEVARFVDLARRLDDGEAMGLAIASNRGWTFASDDRQARKAADSLQTPLLSTPELVKEWAHAAKVSKTQIAAAISRIATMARFKPSPKFPASEWWEKHTREP